MKIEDLNLSALKYFLDAVELESITLSAEKNHVSRSAVSQAVVRLEQWYGKQLLVHEKRNFDLTSDGKTFYRIAKDNFLNLKNGFAQMHEASDALRIGCSASLVDLVFPKIQGLINESSNPVIKVGPTPLLLDLMEQKQIHVAFLIESQKISNYKSREFHSGDFELRSKSGHWSETLITTEPRPEVESFLRYSSKKKLKFTKVLEVESWTLAHRMAEMMNGTCLVPDYLPKGKLQAIKTPSWSFSYRALAITQKESLLSKLESKLVSS